MSVRVLHVLGGMDRGGVETWLMHVLRRIDRERFGMDFLVHVNRACAYDDEIRSLGSRIIPCVHTRRPLRYARELLRILAEHGPYDAVHSHVHHYSGWVLRTARRAGVRRRIAHSHNDTRGVFARSGWGRRLYARVAGAMLRKNATRGFACSGPAAAALFGEDWAERGRCEVLHYGMSFDAFRGACDREAVRAELGIPRDAFVVGHVGRFDPQKNHEFVLRVAEEARRLDPRVHLLLVGDGRLRPDIERAAGQMGLGGVVTFAGGRPDVARVMRGAMDVFLFPSIHEGLGIVVVEAQAAGLPCVVSDGVPEEAVVVDGLVERLRLTDGPAAWAGRLLAARQKRGRMSQEQCLEQVERSSFSLERCLPVLERAYCE
jgi:glycosyltransferase involved in cell wall biosynthesis